MDKYGADQSSALFFVAFLLPLAPLYQKDYMG